MTLEEWQNLRRGDVVQWVDGTLGLVRAAYEEKVRIVWENGSAANYNDLDAPHMVKRAA